MKLNEFNNNTDRFYQLRIVTEQAIDNLDINDINTGVLITTDYAINNPIQINGTINKKEINIIPINSQLLQYNYNSNNLINNNCLQIMGGLDYFYWITIKIYNFYNSNKKNTKKMKLKYHSISLIYNLLNIHILITYP